ncbi:MAG TPA: hypothetical protein DEB40_05365 [Elusimicrobia bacterium]|nr:hypothetical protein [Elusimicrobiota bacterium]HBT61154.1 hypothetical protein [Elusimicrobiota bacterium]
MEYGKFAGLVLAVLLTGCGGVTSRVRQGRVPATLDQTPEHRDYIEAIGIGASDPALPTETQRKSLARDAAIVKAQYELLSMVKGVELSGGIRVERALEKDSSLETRIQEVIRGAEVLKSEFTSDNGCVVTLRLSKKKLARLMGVKF